ncbi:MAG TPA: nitrilase-related carbon-nitrogen hydrolase [Longimicrobiaceae bacterium]
MATDGEHGRERSPLRVALGEYDTGWHDPAGSLARAAGVVGRAAAAGAELVVLPETCTTGFTMEPAAHAEPRTGPSAAGLAELARRHGVHLLAGVATRDASGGGGERFYNSALLFGPDGAPAAEYRKQRLFAFAGEHERYAAGDGPTVVRVGGVRIAPFICFDLRFPELFRAVAPRVDALVLVANWPAARRAHWDVLVRARAIENQCYVVAVNRVGEGGGLEYDGGSVAYDPWGDPVAEAADGGLLVARIDPAEVTRVRSRYPFVEDRRG